MQMSPCWIHSSQALWESWSCCTGTFYRLHMLHMLFWWVTEFPCRKPEPIIQNSMLRWPSVSWRQRVEQWQPLHEAHHQEQTGLCLGTRKWGGGGWQKELQRPQFTISCFSGNGEPGHCDTGLASMQLGWRMKSETFSPFKIRTLLLAMFSLILP